MVHVLANIRRAVNTPSLQIKFVLYPHFTALDTVGAFAAGAATR